MAKLSKDRREWMQKVYGFEPAARLIREIENLPTQAEADAMVARLKNQVNETHAKSGASSQEHPGMAYFGTAFKGMGSNRPAPTLADLQRKAKALSSAIKSTAQATKDVQDAVEAESVRELLDLAYQLDLNENAVLELVKQYSLIEVMTILRTLSTVKSTGKGFKSVFFGVTTDSPDISDVQMMLKQTSGFDPFFT